MLLKDINEYSGIYVACGPTDLRKNVDGLANIIRQVFQMDPFENYLYMFCNKNRNRLKCLWWDQNGFWMCYKRLDGAGARFVWPADPESIRDINVPQIKKLLSGMSVDPPRGFGEITARDF